MSSEATTGRRQAAPSAAFEDRFVGELLPDDFDWVRLVRSHPLTALAVAVGAGYWLGRTHGPQIVEGISERASEQVSRSVQRLSGKA